MACRPPPSQPQRSNVHVLPGDDRLWRELAAAVDEDLVTTARRGHEQRQRVGRLAVAVAVGMVLVGAGLVLPPHHVVAGPMLAQLPELDAGTGDIDGGATVDVHQDDPRARRLAAEKTLPAKPEKSWAAPPCEPGFHAINGACWLRAEPLPVCPAGTYRHTDRRCYAPVAKAPRPPASVDP